MKTSFDAEFLATADGARANEILRACVHCGFCNATCPTYQITGDELDGPRGRIYLIRDLLENAQNEARAQRHLDRCLTCRACETTCPSGVAYGELAEIARVRLGAGRPGFDGLLRALLRWMVPRAGRLRNMARIGRVTRWMLPARLRASVPAAVGRSRNWRKHNAGRSRVSRVLVLNGCAQQVVTPATNRHLETLLDAHGVDVVYAPDEQCCGSLDLHLGGQQAALAMMRRNLDALWPFIDSVDAIISCASGCGVTVKDYARLLHHDEAYRAKAEAVSGKALDVSEYLAHADLALRRARIEHKVAFHAPCTLQHGQRITNVVEGLLRGAGYQLVPVVDGHLCCGSAGTYSVLQPELASELKARKLEALQAHAPDIIASANVGCQSHLAIDAGVAVCHWIELLK